MKNVESGMDTDAIADLLELSIPPRRLEGHGITVPELVKKKDVEKGTAKRILDECNDLTPVKMRNYNGSIAHVYLPNEEAQNYTNWIIKEL